MYWLNSKARIDKLREVRKAKSVLISISDVSNDVIDRFSHWIFLIPITTWLRHFIVNVKMHRSEKKYRQSGPLSVDELEASKMCWVTQRSAFAREYKDPSENKPVSGKSKLKTLYPFLDIDGFIRDGGRLGRSSLPYSQKHPLVIPSNHKMTRLLFLYEHKRLFHAGPQTLVTHIYRLY